MRHILGLLGLIAACGLVLVSAAMNWRFGSSLGNTVFDGHVYGLASVAADCLKAIIPFLIIYALKTRKWTQALAGIALGVICTGYSLTSSLGFAALNRADTTGERLIKVTNYNDTRAELKRLKDKLSWMPQHRPASAINAELESANSRQVKVRGRGRLTVKAYTAGCTKTNWASRKYCPAIFNLKKELAIAKEASRIEQRINALEQRIASATSIAAAGKTDPQADFLSTLFGLKLEDTQTILILLVSLLVEAGSALGFFVVFSLWRMDEKLTEEKSRVRGNYAGDKSSTLINGNARNKHQTRALDGPVSALLAANRKIELQHDDGIASDNDNDVERQRRKERDEVLLPKNALDCFYDDRIEIAEGESVMASELYEDYCTWCDVQGAKPMSLTPFGRQFSQFSIKKAKIAGRIRYIGIRLKPAQTDKTGIRVA